MRPRRYTNTHIRTRAAPHTLKCQIKTIAILSGKGGTGKTTLAIHIVVATEKAGHTAALSDENAHRLDRRIWE